MALCHRVEIQWLRASVPRCSQRPSAALEVPELGRRALAPLSDDCGLAGRSPWGPAGALARPLLLSWRQAWLRWFRKRGKAS